MLASQILPKIEEEPPSYSLTKGNQNIKKKIVISSIS
jgi:hypothetical protein